MEPIQGGQSGTAPTCSSTAKEAESAGTITESVVGPTDLSIQVSFTSEEEK